MLVNKHPFNGDNQSSRSVGYQSFFEDTQKQYTVPPTALSFGPPSKTARQVDIILVCYRHKRNKYGGKQIST